MIQVNADVLKEQVNAGQRFTEGERRMLFEMLDIIDQQHRQLLRHDKWLTWGLCATSFIVGWGFGNVPI